MDLSHKLNHGRGFEGDTELDPAARFRFVADSGAAPEFKSSART